MHTKATTKTGNLDLVIASSFLITRDGYDYDLMHEDWDSNMHFLKFKRNISKAQTYKIGLVSCLMSTAHHQDPQNEAIRIVERAIEIG